VNAEEGVIWVSDIVGVNPVIDFDIDRGSVDVNEVAEK
jgi:hypothetical protein